MKGPSVPSWRRPTATLLLGLLLLGLVVRLGQHLLREPAPEPQPARTGSAASRSDAPRLAARATGPLPAPDASAGTAQASRWTALPAGTRFQRRLALGTQLRTAQSELTSGALDPVVLLRRIRRHALPGVLDLDRWSRGLHEGTGEDSAAKTAAALLAWLVKPRRDPEALALHAWGDPVEAPLGGGAVLRVWTMDGAFPVADLEAGAGLLERLTEIGGDRSEHGYDVVATEGMAQELFPHAPVFAWGPPAAGLYVVNDDVSLIRTIYPARFQRILLKHELVHAYAIRQRGLWSSRFLEEGLAEYLSRLRPGDEGLRVPPQRFANEFAALLAITRRMQARGFGVGGLSIERLLALRPRELYGLGRLGYRVAQAAVAYAGGDAVEAAVRGGTDKPLRTQLQGVTWEQLTAFLEQHAVRGRSGEAIVIDDLNPGRADANAASTRVAGRRQSGVAVQATGITLPHAMRLSTVGGFLELPTSVRAQDAERIRSVLQGLSTDPTGEVLVVAEATGAMLNRFLWSPETLESLQRLIADPEGIDSRAGFVERLYAGLERARTGPAPTFSVWHDRIEPGFVPLPIRGGSVTTGPLLQRVFTSQRAPANVIVCMASLDGSREAMRSILAEARGVSESYVTDEEVTEGLRNALSAYVRWMLQPPTRVLVIDLADGASDAQLVADVFADALGKEAPVALWNPQQPLR